MMQWMMMILNFLMSILARPHIKTSFLILRVLGCVFLILAAGVGIFFLFQAVVPVLGYLESGAILSVLLAGVGFLLLFFSRRKRPRPVDDAIGEVQEIFKKIHMEIKKLDINQSLRDNAPKILLCSFVAGLILSQVKDARKIAQLKEKFLKYKNWLE